MCLSLAACEAAPPTPAIRTIPPPPPKPAIAVEKPAPAPKAEPVACQMRTRAGTCWGEQPKFRLQKLTTP